MPPRRDQYSLHYNNTGRKCQYTQTFDLIRVIFKVYTRYSMPKIRRYWVVVECKTTCEFYFLCLKCSTNYIHSKTNRYYRGLIILLKKTNSEWNININGIWNIWMYNISWKKYSAMWLVTYYWLLTPVKFFNVFDGVIFGFLLDVNCILLLLANVIHNRTFYICFYFINVLYLQKYLRPIIYRVYFIWKNSNPNVRYNCRWHKLDN